MHDHEGLDGWTFTEREVSANVYEVKAVSPYGNAISSTGTDPERLMAEVVAAARKMAADIAKKLGGGT